MTRAPLTSRLRTTTLAGAVLVTVLALAGCSSSTPDATAPSQTPVAGGVTPEIQGTVTVFAAASLTGTFDALKLAFESANPGVEVVYNYGGSSALAEQIVQGAPVDVFAAASTATMTTVTDASLTAADPVNFATNTLEIAVPVGNPGKVDGLDDFADKDLAIAVCAEEVPCGAASAKIFEATGITPSVDTYEQDVKSVLTKVELGEADAGLVYVTDVKAAGDKVEGVEFPEAADAVNDYPIASLADSSNPDAATAFVDFVLSDEGQSALSAAGFGTP